MLYLLILLLTCTPKEMGVFETNGNVITIEDNRGGLYDFYGEGFKEGDMVIALVDEHDKANPYDDEIKHVIKIRKRGE